MEIVAKLDPHSVLRTNIQNNLTFTYNEIGWHCNFVCIEKEVTKNDSFSCCNYVGDNPDQLKQHIQKMHLDLDKSLFGPEHLPNLTCLPSYKLYGSDKRLSLIGAVLQYQCGSAACINSKLSKYYFYLPYI